MKYDIASKVILTDCDGVLMDWLYAFHGWVASVHGLEIQRDDTYDLALTYGIKSVKAKELVRNFNSSAAISYVPPLRDAVKYVKKLHEEHGYVFHCITSLSLDPSAYKAREYNLHQLFGKTAFEKLVCLDTGADKDYALEEYRDTGCYWIEDKKENVELGTKLGLNSIIIDHPFNRDYSGPALRVNNWKEFYDTIV